MRLPFGRNFVRVQFHPLGKEYVYYCPDARIGDWVTVPPSCFCKDQQTVEVVGLGRRLWTGKVKPCALSNW